MGSCGRVHRVHKRLLRRNELAVIGPYEEGRGEFVVCHFTVRVDMVKCALPGILFPQATALTAF